MRVLKREKEKYVGCSVLSVRSEIQLSEKEEGLDEKKRGREPQGMRE